jgi:Transposase DDE domain group 1
VKNSARAARVAVSADGRGLVSRAGAVLLWETMRVTGLGRGLTEGLARWRPPRAVHDPGKIVADLAAAVALGGDCLADIAVLREQPELAGPVASDPVVSRLASTLAADLPRSLKAIRTARAAARERARALAGDAAPGAGGGLVTVDLDATIVIAHSEKEQAAPTWKRTFGFHPMTAFAGHGQGGNGEPLAIVLRAGNAGPDTAADHIEAARLPLAQLPARLRGRVLVRADSGGGTREFLKWLTARSRPLHYSTGMTITEDMQEAIGKVPAQSWTPACDGDGRIRDGAWVADITGLLTLQGWPAGMRVIVRKERPHPGAQLRFTDIDGHRFTAFATDAKRGQLADLELRHRRRARCEDRIRCAKDTGLRNLPLKGYAQNQLWCEIVALACELLAWTQMLALTGEARRWEPKRLRLRLLAVAGRLVRGGRRLRLRLAQLWLWATGITAARSPACRPSHPADQPEHPYDAGRRTPGARGTPPTRRDSRATRHGRHLKPTTSRTPQASRSRARKIEVSKLPATWPYRPPSAAHVIRWQADPNRRAQTRPRIGSGAAARLILGAAWQALYISEEHPRRISQIRLHVRQFPGPSGLHPGKGFQGGITRA